MSKFIAQIEHVDDGRGDTCHPFEASAFFRSEVWIQEIASQLQQAHHISYVGWCDGRAM